MKKVFMMTAAAMVMAVPAMAGDWSEEKIEEKAQMYMQEIDTNSDGMISQAEHQAFANGMFEDADSNDDGSISSDEFMAFKKEEMKEKKEKM